MICPDCNKEYNNRLLYCISCGTELINSEQDISDTNSINTNKIEMIGIIEDTEFHEDDISASVREITHYRNNQSNDIKAENALITHDVPYENSSENIIPISVKKAGAAEIMVNFRNGLVSFVLSVLMLGFIVLTIGSYLGNCLTNENKINSFVFSADLLSIPAAEVPVINSELIADNPNATITEAICAMSDGLDITKADIERIYESSTIKDFLSDSIKEYADYVRTGNAAKSITSDDIKNIYTENIDLINSTLGITLNEHDIDMAFTEIEKAEPVLAVISTENIGHGSLSRYIAPLRIYISFPVMCVEIGLVIVMFVLIAMLNKKAGVTFKWSSFPFLISGISLLVFTYLVVMKIIAFDTNYKFIKNIVEGISDVMSGELYAIGAVLSALGLLFAFLSVGFKTKTK